MSKALTATLGDPWPYGEKGPEGRRQGYSEEDVVRGEKAVVLVPVN